MRTLMLVTLCLMTLFFLVTLGMDATHCSTNQKREMLKRICGNYRRKRGFTDHNNLWIPKRHHHLGLYRNVVIDHRNNFEVVANDTSGGILIRHKRNSLLMYCCTTLKNCSRHFTC